MNLIDREIEKFEKFTIGQKYWEDGQEGIGNQRQADYALHSNDVRDFLRSSLQRVIDETKLGHFWYCPFEDCDFMNDDRGEMCDHIKSHHLNKIVDETKEKCIEALPEKIKDERTLPNWDKVLMNIYKENYGAASLSQELTAEKLGFNLAVQQAKQNIKGVR
jgi:hypothetical protein